MIDLTRIDLDTVLGDVVNADERLAAKLDSAGIDYCCGGRRTLGQAAAEAGIDGADLLELLLDGGEAQGSPPDWSRLDAPALCAHITSVHHEPLRTEVPRLLVLSDKVRGVHSDNHPELAELDDALKVLWSELEPHLDEEEEKLFPPITAGEPVGDDLLDRLGADHDVVGALLDTIRSLTDSHRPPADACGSYQELYRSLARLDADTRLHVHKENNVLFTMVATAT